MLSGLLALDAEREDIAFVSVSELKSALELALMIVKFAAELLLAAPHASSKHAVAPMAT